MTAYAREQVAPGMTAADAVEAIGLALHRDMSFDPDATTVDTPPSEAFARRHGVCQDFAQVMIASLRGIGIPAGYVSGFLRTNPPPGQPRLEGADAMHAWVRAWSGGQTGWIEYDPTNAMPAGTDHILVARGRDYGDVAPVKGMLRIAGDQKTEHAVDVIPEPDAGPRTAVAIRPLLSSARKARRMLRALHCAAPAKGTLSLWTPSRSPQLTPLYKQAAVLPPSSL